VCRWRRRKAPIKLPVTGAQIADLMGVAFILLALGSVLVLASRRRRRTAN
jgi:LPXTG-motif cell wall-anchored protein